MKPHIEDAILNMLEENKGGDYNATGHRVNAFVSRFITGGITAELDRLVETYNNVRVTKPLYIRPRHNMLSLISHILTDGNSDSSNVRRTEARHQVRKISAKLTDQLSLVQDARSDATGDFEMLLRKDYCALMDIREFIDVVAEFLDDVELLDIRVRINQH